MDGGGFMTLSVVFDPEKQHVLMCHHEKQGLMNFVGGKSRASEEYIDAAYRELLEETGIPKDAVDLKFVRCEHVSNKVPNYPECWNLYVMAGVLKHNVELVTEKNQLLWVNIHNHRTFQYYCFGNGDCWLFLNEAAKVLGIDITSATIPSCELR